MSSILNSFESKKTLTVNGKNYHYNDLNTAEKNGLSHISQLPFSLKVLLENLLRCEDGHTVTKEDILAIQDWIIQRKSSHEINFRPARVLMQDFTGVPAVVDLAAMRAAMLELGGDPERINPLSPVDLIIDHSVQVMEFGTPQAFASNVASEIAANQERYELLRWAQKAFTNFRVVPPGTGICHQVNLEYLAKTVWFSEQNGELWAYPDTLVGTDSHTTMVNGLGVLGWGVGGIEAEAAMLGQAISMLIPEVVGVKLSGKLKEGITATDLVLTITQMLRQKGVVGKFVEFYGPGLKQLSLADRATIANMAPEYGATCGFFPIDQVTIDYLKFSGRETACIQLTEAYAKIQGLWHEDNQADPIFSDTLSLDLDSVEPSLAGPTRPQDKVNLITLPTSFQHFLTRLGKTENSSQTFSVPNTNYRLQHGDIVIAAITSCTNTSNPSVLMAAGLLAKKAIEKGLQRKPWVKSSLAPGSKVVTSYLAKAGLQSYLDQLGFNLVGYGCTTCIGNSGPLPENISQTITEQDLVVCSILSGNRNFEGRIHPLVKANWLASPPLVVAYALAGNVRIDLTREPLGFDQHQQAIFLKDIWPSTAEITEAIAAIDRQMFCEQYADVFTGDNNWQHLNVSDDKTFHWQENSTYIQYPPFFKNLTKNPQPLQDIHQAQILALLEDSITTDHISPAGTIKKDSPAGQYLLECGTSVQDFNSYGARRGNHEVMMRGTFANIRIRNQLVPNIEGGFTRYWPTHEVLSIYDAAMRYQETNTPLVIIAGKEYGTGSSRDWAAKGTLLLGVKAVIAESYERIHRSNLIGMGVLPLQFIHQMNSHTLQLQGDETISIQSIADKLSPGILLNATITFKDGKKQNIPLLCRIDTQNELAYYQHGGILPYVLRKMLNQ